MQITGAFKSRRATYKLYPSPIQAAGLEAAFRPTLASSDAR